VFTPAEVVHSATAAKFLMRAAADTPLLAGLLALALPAVLGCDAGAECGRCLLLIDTSDCPANLTWTGEHALPICESAAIGELCQGRKHCGDHLANNCPNSNGGNQNHDVFLRVEPPPYPPGAAPCSIPTPTRG